MSLIIPLESKPCLFFNALLGVLLTECRPIWAKRSFFYSLGGVHRPEVHSASACRDACLQERSCIAADIQWAGNVLDDSLICRLHFDRTKLLVPLLMANTEQWELVERCSMIDVGVTSKFLCFIIYCLLLFIYCCLGSNLIQEMQVISYKNYIYLCFALIMCTESVKSYASEVREKLSLLQSC